MGFFEAGKIPGEHCYLTGCLWNDDIYGFASADPHQFLEISVMLRGGDRKEAFNQKAPTTPGSASTPMTRTGRRSPFFRNARAYPGYPGLLRQ